MRKLHIETMKNRSFTAGKPLHIIRPRLDDLLHSCEPEPELIWAQIIIVAAAIYFGIHIVLFLVR